MMQRTHGRIWDYALLLAVCGLVFGLNLGASSLWDADEGRNATAAYEMVESGNWVVPTFNGKLRDHKPALLYWLQAIAYILFGVNEFSARLPCALAALATVGIIYELARAMFGSATGRLSAFAFATMPMACASSRFANPDALLNLFCVTYLAIFWFHIRRPSTVGYALLGVAAGLGVLAKGPVGLILPAAVAVVFLAWERRWSFLYQPGLLLTSLTFGLTALPWYIWVAVETRGEFVRNFFFNHNLARGLMAMEDHDGFFGYYAIVLIVGLLPWSIFYPVSIWLGVFSAVRHPWERLRASWNFSHDAAAETQEANGFDSVSSYRLLTAWLVVYLTFYSVAATKLPNYILPVAAPSAILIGRYLHRWRVGELRIPAGLVHAGAASLMLMGGVIFVALLVLGGIGMTPFVGTESMQLQWWSALGLIVLALAVVCWRFARVGKYRRFVKAVGVSAVVTVSTIFALGQPLTNQIKAPRPLMEQLGEISDREDIRLGGYDVEHLASFNFYSHRNVEDLPDELEVTEFLSSKLKTYVFMPVARWRQIEPMVSKSIRIVGRGRDLLKNTEVVVVTNQ